MVLKTEFVDDCVKQEGESGRTGDMFHLYDVEVDARRAFEFATKYNYILVKK